MLTDTQLIDQILQHEGSTYTNRASDRGGPTKFGITQKTLSNVRGRPVEPQEVAALTEAEARDIYHTLFIHCPGFDLIKDDCLRAQLVDFGVTSGPGTATETLQRLLAIQVDGNLGPKTVAAVAAQEARWLANQFAAERAKFYANIVIHDEGQTINLRGWLNRALSYIN